MHAHTESIFYQVRARRGESSLRSPGAPCTEPAGGRWRRRLFAESCVWPAARTACIRFSRRAAEQTTIHVAQPARGA